MWIPHVFFSPLSRLVAKKGGRGDIEAPSPPVVPKKKGKKGGAS